MQGNANAAFLLDHRDILVIHSKEGNIGLHGLRGQINPAIQRQTSVLPSSVVTYHIQNLIFVNKCQSIQIHQKVEEKVDVSIILCYYSSNFIRKDDEGRHLPLKAAESRRLLRAGAGLGSNCFRSLPPERRDGQ